MRKSIFVMLITASLLAFGCKTDLEKTGSSERQEYRLTISNPSSQFFSWNKIGVITNYDYSRNVSEPEVESSFTYKGPEFLQKGLGRPFELQGEISSSRNISGDSSTTVECQFQGYKNTQIEQLSVDFKIIKDTDSMSYEFETKSATLKYIGQKCQIWTLNEDTYNEIDVKTLGEKFDAIYEYETNIVGNHYLEEERAYYSNLITPKSSDKINILLYDIDGDGENGSILGYFYANDFYDKSYSSTSNQTEIFYIDSYYASTNFNEALSTLAHEFNHMLNFVNKTVKYGLLYDTWYTEMLSMTIEDILQKELGIEDYDSPKQRLATFNTSMNVGFSYTPFWSSSDYYSFVYANGYAFGTYLMRNYGGIKLIHEIATNKYIDTISITKALKAVSASETSYEAVFKRFGEVLFNTDNSSSSLCSLNIAINETYNGKTYSSDAIDLTKNYYSEELKTAYYDEYGEELEWPEPFILPAYYQSFLMTNHIDTYNNSIALYPTGFIVQGFTAPTDWNLDDIVSKNSSLNYVYYY